MAHQLEPSVGAPYLSPDEVAARLRDEFDWVEADREAGADGVGDMLAQFVRMKG